MVETQPGPTEPPVFSRQKNGNQPRAVGNLTSRGLALYRYNAIDEVACPSCHQKGWRGAADEGKKSTNPSHQKTKTKRNMKQRRTCSNKWDDACCVRRKGRSLGFGFRGSAQVPLVGRQESTLLSTSPSKKGHASPRHASSGSRHTRPRPSSTSHSPSSRVSKTYIISPRGLGCPASHGCQLGLDFTPF